MNYCKKCGSQIEDHAKFCTNCGAPVSEDQTAQQNMAGETQASGGNQQADYSLSQTSYDRAQNTYGNYNQGSGFGTSGYGVGSNLGILNRSIPLALIFSIITCGIYAIYWLIKLNDEINQLAGETTATSGGMVFLFSLITCGIYQLYWLFKMGERCEKIKGISGSLNILFLILGIFGFSIIAYCLIQDTINKAIA